MLELSGGVRDSVEDPEVGSRSVGGRSRGPGVERISERVFLWAVWVPAYFGLQMLAFTMILGLDPGGLDVCEASASGSTRRLQVAVGALSLTALAGLALWRLRDWRMLVASLLLAPSVVVWSWLLGGIASADCG